MRIREISKIIAGILLLTAASAVPAQEITLYNFKGSNSSDGSVPACALVMDAAGNIYGTTTSGGAVGAPFDTYGTVFELSPGSGGTWTEKVLYSFGATAGDGIGPVAGVILDANGNLYGTTSQGGANGGGTVYELSPGTGGTWTEKVLYSFGATSTDAASPRRGSLIFDAAGNLYGTTFLGGTNTVSNGAGVQKAGTVFELSPGTGGVWTEKILYNFGATTQDAANSLAGLVFDATGNLYGTTQYGGVSNSGTAFELSPAGGGAWSEAVLHSFADNGTDGSLPESGLTFDTWGNLYGTTYGGGSNPYSGGLGAIFELSPAGGGQWTEQVIYSFNAVAGVGDYPFGGVIFDASGNLYTTASSGLYAFGQVLELSPGAGGWTEKRLYAFGDTPDGYAPENGVILDSNGNLFGTTSTGGSFTADFGLGGTVYEIPNVTTADPVFSPPSGVYTTAQSVSISDTTPSSTIFYSIDGGAYAEYSSSIEVSASETIQAYATSGSMRSNVVTGSYGIGNVVAPPAFSLPSGNYDFAQSVTLTDPFPGAAIYYTTNGTTPTATPSELYSGPITVSSSETIQAIATVSGYTNSTVASAAYTITILSPPNEKVLYSFDVGAAFGTDGAHPVAGLVSDAQGNLYGTNQNGGTGLGTIFELSPGAGGTWTEKVLYTFSCCAGPDSVLVFDKLGNLYGTTPGDSGSTVFQLVPTASGPWTMNVIYTFQFLTTDGVSPEGGLIFDAQGNLYGTTKYGGANYLTEAGPGGTVFELTPTTSGPWTEKILHSFALGSDGYYPVAGLVFDTMGNLYGTTLSGGPAADSQGGGTVFELSPGTGGTWTETILRGFGGCTEFCTDGYNPKAGLVIDAAGNLYGTTSAGGPNGFGADGVAFELSPSGSTWTEKILHNFGSNETDGIDPYAGLVFDTQGDLYGATEAGGTDGVGTVFELTPEPNGTWAEAVLHSFKNTDSDGQNPYGGVILDAAANLYGTTWGGGATSTAFDGAVGTVFEIASVITVKPTFNPPAGTYSATQMVALSDATPGATIYYTTNGDTPTTSSTKYTAKINVTASQTIKAFAVATGLPPSMMATATYQILIPAKLTSPTPGSTLTGTSATFTWTAGQGTNKYEFQLGTTGPGSSNVYNPSGTTTTALSSPLISNIPAYGVTLYARLKSYINGAWQYNDYTYMESGTPVKAVLTSPTPGTTLTGTSVTFNWTAGGGVTKYELQLGITGLGSSNVYNAAGTTTNGLTTGAITVPANGVTVYARLKSYINGAWQYNDYTYMESGTPIKAALTSPTPGTTLTGTSVTFNWTAGGGVTKYEFQLGIIGHGSSNVYNAAGTTTNSLTTGAIAVPANGVTLYARLYSYINGAWQYNDYTYTESGTPTKAALTAPTPGSTLTGTSATFTWTAGGGVTKYEFELGTTGHGSSNVYNAAGTSTTALTSPLITGIPANGVTLYARLYSYINGAWQYNDYTYMESGTPVKAVLTSPTPGITLTGSSATFTWTAGGGVTKYLFELGTTGHGSSNVYNSAGTSTTALTTGVVSGIPTTGATLYARLYSYINGAWQYNDYTFTEQ